jgi:hypothetical protein
MAGFVLVFYVELIEMDAFSLATALKTLQSPNNHFSFLPLNKNLENFHFPCRSNYFQHMRYTILDLSHQFVAVKSPALSCSLFELLNSHPCMPSASQLVENLPSFSAQRNFNFHRNCNVDTLMLK